jgi:hypothetical protein
LFFKEKKEDEMSSRQAKQSFEEWFPKVTRSEKASHLVVPPHITGLPCCNMRNINHPPFRLNKVNGVWLHEGHKIVDDLRLRRITRGRENDRDLYFP